MTNRILSGRCNPDTIVADAGVIYKTFHKFTMKDTLDKLANALDHDPFVLIVTEQRCFSTPRINKRKLSVDSKDEVEFSSSPVSKDGATDQSTMSLDAAPRAKVITRSVVSGIVSRIDLLDFISSGGGD